MEYLSYVLMALATLLSLTTILTILTTDDLKDDVVELTASMWIGAGVVWFISHWPV